MTREGSGIETQEPFVVHETADDTGGRFVRFELTLYPHGSSAEDEFGLPRERWAVDYPTEHVHPHQAERWGVVSGGSSVAFGGDERVLTEGDTATLPAGVPHRVWNPIEEPSHVTMEVYPGQGAQEFAETLYVLAQFGETDEEGHLTPLQFAVTEAAYPGQLYLAAIPVGVQKALLALLAPIGRLAGYRAGYSLDDLQ